MNVELSATLVLLGVLLALGWALVRTTIQHLNRFVRRKFG